MQIETRWNIGVNCGTTAAMNTLKNTGIDLPEHLLFGLGKGLGFTYYADASLPYPFVSGRGNHLYENILNSLGFDTRLYGGDAVQIDSIFARLQEGKPSVVLLNLNHLSYIMDKLPEFQEPYLYSEHHAMVVGGDQKENYILVKDHLWPVMKFQLEDFMGAWNSPEIIPKPLINYYYDDLIHPAHFDRDNLATAVLFAIYRNFHELKFPCNPTNNVSGVRGMSAFLNDMVSFNEKYDAEQREVILFNMLISIEKLGTGGGNFRRFYSRFLKEAARITNLDVLLEYSAIYHELSEKWKIFNKSLEQKINEKENHKSNLFTGDDIALITQIIETEKETIEQMYSIVLREVA